MGAIGSGSSAPPARTNHTGATSGRQALAYARARKTLPGGDFDRSRHQGQLLLGGLGTFQRQVAQDPAKVMTWLSVMRDEVRSDLPFPELLRLALLATACVRRVAARGDDPAIFCACPHVSDALLEVGSDLARFLVPLVAPPVGRPNGVHQTPPRSV